MMPAKIKPVFNGEKLVILLANNFQNDSRVLKEALSAVAAGLDVTVIARKSRDTKETETRDGIKIIRVTTILDKIWSLISPSAGREVAGSQAGGAPKSLVIYAAVINTWLLNNCFAKVGIKIRPQIVHANDSTSLQAGYAIKRKTKAKLVYDAHELYTEQLVNPHPFWKKYFLFQEKKLKQVDAIFSVNQSILDEIDKRYKTYKIPKAILYNTPYYEKNSLRHHKDAKLLYLGHYMQGRGLENLFQAVNEMSNIKLAVYGRGFSAQNKKIHINEPVPPQEVVSAAKNYDIGILPYIGDTLNNLYSTPNKLFEYMMAGLAVAASNLPEIAKIVKKEKIGVLFDPTKPEDMVRKIKYLASHPKILAQMKKNSLRAAQKYCWENQAAKQIKIYAQAIRNS